MKQMMLIITLLLSLYTQATVHLYHNNNAYASHVEQELKKHHIPFQYADTIDPQSSELYIIIDILAVKEELPKYYIGYQLQDITHKLTTRDIKRLSNAIAVWDYSSININYYKSKIHHYYYFPQSYEFADPILLPCLLPTQALSTYKAVLSYSNTVDTDISSHLPALFCQVLIQDPTIIVEAGVRGGESTKAFAAIRELCPTILLGIDINNDSQSAYQLIKGAQFLCMNDLDFGSFYKTSQYHHYPIDAIFIDTSHLYEHTMQEIKEFLPLLSSHGMLLFHDSNVTPLSKNIGYWRINNTYGFANGNTRGVTQAIKEYFAIAFDEYHYNNFTFDNDGIVWRIIHYPFCNGLTILKKESV